MKEKTHLPRLSMRLSTLVEMLDGSGEQKLPYPCVCDVGCDHGWIAITLCLKNVAKRVIASDVVTGPLDRAKQHVKEYGLSGRIDTILSDGLSHLAPGGAQAAVIAGMGGFLIRDILREAEDRNALPDTLVLQPQNGQRELRSCLRDLGFGIEKESMVREDGKYYVILRAIRTNDAGQEAADEVRDEFGGFLLDHSDPILFEYLKKEEEKFTGIMEQIPGGAKEPGERLAMIKKGLRYWGKETKDA